MYVNPVTVEESPSKDLNQSSAFNRDSLTSPTITSSLQNGEAPQKVGPEVKGLTKAPTNQEIKYKRPPPRPPSLSSAGGMGLLFSSPPSLHALSSSAGKKKEEGRGGGEREERKSVSTSPHPSRPPVPLQSRTAPPLPPAPLRRTSSRKSTTRDVGEGREREKGQNPAKETVREGAGERGHDKAENKSGMLLLGEAVEQENSDQQDEVVKKGREDEKKENEIKEDDKQKASSQCQPLVKKPSRPVPPPRRKPCVPESPVCPNQAGGGLANQSAAVRVPPPSPARRPDVSLYSPQGSAVIGTDPDSCSTSSAEEEGEPSQEQEQSHK